MSRITWEALACESKAIASDLSNKNFLSKQEWESYKKAAAQLHERFKHLSEDAPSLKDREMTQLHTECHLAIKTIRVRLNYFHPDKKTDIKSKFYETQVEHLRLRIGELKKNLDRGLGVDPQHGNLFTSHNKACLIEREIEMLKSRISDIQRKQAALH